MPYLIDGHNLIPKIPGLNLADPDDEMHLVEMLQDYCRVTRKRVEVFFDNAPPGVPRVRNFGNVIARFVRQGSTADHAIQEKLRRLARSARNWTVVTSDLWVQAAAHAAGARVLSSESFAHHILDTLSPNSSEPRPGDKPLSGEELESWLKLFGIEDDSEEDQ